MKRQFLIASIASLSLFLLSAISCAQEPATEEPPTATQKPAAAAQEPAEKETATEYSYGTVNSVTEKRIIISEYDYEKDEEVNVTYEIEPKVELKNVKSVKEIEVGDSVDIAYLVKDGKKVATVIIDVDKEPMPEEVEKTAGPEEKGMSTDYLGEEETAPISEEEATEE